MIKHKHSLSRPFLAIGASLSGAIARLTRLSARWFSNAPDGWAVLPMLLVLMAIAAPAAMAQDAAEPASSLADVIFQPVVDVLSVVLFFKIGGENGFPFIVLWLFVAAVFFTFRMGFINLRGLKHAIAVVQGKFDDPHDEGEVSHFQALATAVSGTVGLGNIAGCGDRDSAWWPWRHVLADGGGPVWHGQ